MLTEQSVLSAVSASNKFSAIGKSILPVPNTLLDRLVSATYLKLNNASPINNVLKTADDNDTVSPYQQLAEVVSYITTSSEDTISAHDTVMGDSLGQIATFVNQHINYARSEVKPMVLSFLKDLNGFFERNNEKSAESSVCIEEYDVPQILTDETFIDGIKYVNGRTLLTPDSTVDINEVPESILSLLLTNDKSYDEQIMPWASKLDENVLKSIWASFFTKKIPFSKTTTNMSNAFIESLPIYYRLDAALVVYLTATNLYNSPRSTSDGMSLARYKELLSQTKDYAAGIIWTGLQRLSLSAKTGTIILGVDAKNKTAVVFKPVYDSWLDLGGKPETIIGIIVSGRQLYVQSAIDANSADLEKAWNSYKTFYNASEINKRIDMFKEYMYSVFLRYLTNPGEYVTKYKESHPAYEENAKKLYEEFSEKLVLKDLDNLNGIALYVVGKIIFYYTDAYSILNMIERNCENNKDLDIREAALLATIEYVTNYVMAQMTVS